MADSALIVKVSEVEPLVGSLRSRFDKISLLGVPAHITVLYPFIPPDRIDESIKTRLEEIFSNIESFDFFLSEIGRFPTTAYLAPNPHTPFVNLTAAVFSAFPDYPPYKGEFKKVIPHLTFANGTEIDAQSAAQELSQQIKAVGVVQGKCRAVTLIENSNVVWKEMYEFNLK